MSGAREQLTPAERSAFWRYQDARLVAYAAWLDLILAQWLAGKHRPTGGAPQLAPRLEEQMSKES